MRTHFLPLATLLLATAIPAQFLTTTFAGGNAQSGNMFDLRAITPVTISSFDVHLAMGTWDLEVYRLTAANTPYLPSINVAANWTLVGTTTGVTGLGVGLPTPLPIPINVAIAANQTQAFYVTVSNGGFLQYTNGVTTGALLAQTPELQIFEGSGVAHPFTANFSPRNFNGTIYYSTAAGFATKSNYGGGCYASPRMVSELFPGDTTPIDLVGTSWVWNYNPSATGGTYTIAPGGVPYDAVTPALNGLNLITTAPTASSSAGTWDDASSVQPLGFNFPYPNNTSATVSDITINSNGRIYLGSTFAASFAATGANSGFTPTSFAGTTGPGLPVIAGFMCDLDPAPGTGGGAIWFESPSPSGGVRITWDNIPNWQDPAYTGLPAQINSVQLQLLPGGLIFLSYGSSLGNGGSVGNEAIVGFSAGGGEPVQRLDWSAITSYQSGSGRLAPTIDASALPIYGTSPNIVVSNLGATTLFGGVIAGTTVLNPGVSLLGPLGVPCNLHATPDVLVLGVAAAGSFTVPFPIPNNAMLTGFVLAAQGFGLDPTLVGPLPLNSLGGLLSGGLRLTVGM
ncbi:MAG: hypothetical protein ABIP94_03755 [Planctomycetota bacterium]